MYGQQSGAAGLENLDCSLAGNPEHPISVDGRHYTWSMLNYYINYAYCCRHVKFERIQTVVELGSGAGRQAEVLKKLHPELTLYLFDLAPSLYICYQYLSTVFSDAVASYQETRGLTTLPNPDGRIYILGNWQYPLLTRPFDFFWNANSFQEMEPDVVRHYLSFVNKQASMAYLRERMEGKELAAGPGQHGVLKKTTLEDYRAGLPEFKLLDMSPAPYALRPPSGYHNSIWERSGAD
ncbi:MAG: putative sugar O-methyltransferase [SAR202 cluster bacterium]|nr:putative sugar O-methyltransferase [SAR202 cluster bacterium]